jgi:acylphosphatase
MKKQAFLLKISGIVTGVGFRWATLDKSKEFHSISGYVRNIKTGEVEVFIQGAEDELTKMIDWLRKGPASAKVKNMEEISCPINDNYQSFTIN